jgi:hypothetical protein
MSGSLQDYGAQQASAYGVPVNLFNAVINAESGWDPNSYNTSSGATGIAQFLPSTAANAGYGIAPFDPTNSQSSLSAAAQYLSALYNSTGSWTGALNAYSGNSQGGQPYPGNSGVADALSSLDSSAPTTAGGSPTASAGGTAASQEPAVLSGVSSWLGTYAKRGALILISVLLLLGAIYLFASRTQEVQSQAA